MNDRLEVQTGKQIYHVYMEYRDYGLLAPRQVWIVTFVILHK